MRRIPIASLMCLSLALFACQADDPDSTTIAETSGEGDGDGDPTTSGDGDGEPATGDGDGDGDGDPTTSGDGDGEPATGDGDGEPESDCLGPEDPVAPPDGATQPEDPKAPGSTWAHFELEDFQPQSCNFGQATSLEAFKGRVTLAVFVRATCEICQGTIAKLEEMQLQLGLEGHEVYMVGINQAGYEDAQFEFVDRASFPLLQDVAEVDAWGLMGTGTDDMYIYDAEGQLTVYYSYADANPSIDLNTDEGWDEVYNAILGALDQ